jgi:acetyl-CoA C-acetyltransferase
MPEAVIVATARSPIGRAFKGSLKEIRPDDLAAQMVRAVLDKVPELDPHDIDDLVLGCGLPGGQQGFNMGRVVATMLGYDFLPAATLTRYCGSSLQTTRMAMHAIRAGEADVYVSAGVESVSSFAAGNSDTWPDTRNPVFADSVQRTETAAQGGQTWHDPRDDGQLPDIYMAMGQTAENLAQIKGVTREDQDAFGVRSQNLAEKAIADGFWARDITPVTLPDGSTVDSDDGPRAGVTLEGVSELKPVFRPDGTVTAGNCCPLNDGAAAVVVMSDSKARELGLTPLARIVSTASPPCRRRSWGSARSGRRSRRSPVPDEHRRHRPGRDQRGVRRAGDPLGSRPGHRRGQAQRQRRGHRGRSPVRHDGGAHHVHAHQLVAAPRQADRSGDHVRRRWPGMAMVLERLS